VTAAGRARTCCAGLRGGLTILAPVMLLAGILIYLGKAPDLAEEGEFRIVHGSPIFQGITRMAFMHQSPSERPSIHFSTLESYGRDPLSRFLLVAYEPASGHLTSQTVKGSPEARSYAYSTALNRYVLGTSLDPNLLLYDPDHRTVEPVFHGPHSNTWIHRLAVKDEYAYTILSTASSPIRGFGGILKVNLRTGQSEVIPYSDSMEQGWGGVQTIDPTGRVWFYRAFPLRQMWYDAEHGMRNRMLPGYESWTVESWDVWDGDAWLVLTNTQGEFIKKRVRLKDLKIVEGPRKPLSRDTRVFLASMRLDLYHTQGPSPGTLYFNPNTSSFYRRNPATDTFTFLGSIDLGDFQVMGFQQSPQESSTRWMHPTWGEIQVLGVSHTGDLVLWLTGRKTYGTGTLHTGSVALHDIPIANLSPADITSLVVDRDGFIYGGGYLTMSHMFRFDPTTNESQLFKGAIPNAEGQINSMFTGLDGKIYGAGYPDSVIFRFDPSAPWNPGNALTSNPVNLGPMEHHRQMRARRGVQALDGTVWYQSTTDYDFPIAHALAKADFANRTLVVKTDLDDAFPIVDDLAVLDEERLILLGKKDGKPGLYVLNQRAFRIESRRDLAKPGGILANLDPRHPGASRLFLAQGRKLYRVRRDLALELVHRSPKAIVRILSGTGEDIFLVGKTYIEKIDLSSSASEVWWRTWWSQAQYPGGYVFRHLSWTPVVFYQEALFFADEEKLWRFSPPAW